MKRIKNVFLSAIHQNAGKTTITLGLYKLLKEKGLRIAFMKPVGQKVVTVQRHRVDKDSYLIGEIYRCSRRFKDMSPVTVGRGFTEKYIFRPNKDILRGEIRKSFDKLSTNKDIMIVEGTGHAGVGSVIDVSNADVASMLGSKVIIVSEGGIGKSIDEIILNKALFDLRHVEILGVIVNKVLPDKYQKIKRNLSQGLKNKGIRLLGVIPLDPMLTFPTVEQMMEQLGLRLLCRQSNLKTHVKNTIVAAMEPQNVISYLKDGTLVITSGDRIDNILVSISSYLIKESKASKIAGVILTGGLLPNLKIMDLLKKSRIPVLISDGDTYSVAARIKSMTYKIEKTDKDKIAEATKLVKKYVDINAILKYL
ncbi:MAG TPA: AAA family ATPase [Candidatus Omnitrophota bacterium]|nr:AAA family ATPase [Candidatus Omnitrophota bacterium]HPD84546.1 AAA family ATPase [Candidatus Omnitrophota bacterium]HRZ03404.1 AAA family ATPase [Candidatus Omnitrophota bacterium]